MFLCCGCRISLPESYLLCYNRIIKHKGLFQMNTIFENVKKNFGFGMMRLPMLGEEVDIPQVKKMVDMFLSAGFNYFDTAHGYLDHKSELAIRECLTSRYPRERYVLTDKLSIHYFETEAQIRPLFQKQLDACGVEYFDFYLLHAMSLKRLPHFLETHAMENLVALKKEGKIRHIGMSFHDSAEALEHMLTVYPEIEVVQLQFNYLDFEDEKVESRKCYEVCQKFGKPVIVMEPVKGGALVNLPDSAQKIFDSLQSGSNASYAIRFAAGFPNVKMVLSGMSDLAQMEDNLRFMADFKPLDAEEAKAVETVSAILRNQGLIACTGCRYCMEVCPQEIPIPTLFSALNEKHQNGTAEGLPTAIDCLGCGKCEDICPQTLPIRELLTVAKAELSL